MGKRIYIGYESAQAFWRKHDGASLQAFECLELPAPFHACASAKAISTCCVDDSFVTEEGAITVLVARPEDRRRSGGVESHVWNHPCRYYRVSDGVYVSSPEDTALQLACKMGFEEALLYLYELAGTYARAGGSGVRAGAGNGRGGLGDIPARPEMGGNCVRAGAAGGRARAGGSGAYVCDVADGTYACTGMDGQTTYDVQALASVADLERHFAEAGRIRGVRMLREAVCFVLGNSASPMESCLTAQLVLPESMGGYELERPVLNQRVVVTRTGEYRVGDLYWPRQRVDLEYQSDEFHSGYESRVRDGMRSNELVAAANKVFQANFDHFRVPGAMDLLVAQLSHALGRRPPASTPAAKAARAELRRRLLLVDGITV